MIKRIQKQWINFWPLKGRGAFPIGKLSAIKKKVLRKIKEKIKEN